MLADLFTLLRCLAVSPVALLALERVNPELVQHRGACVRKVGLSCNAHITAADRYILPPLTTSRARQARLSLGQLGRDRRLAPHVAEVVELLQAEGPEHVCSEIRVPSFEFVADSQLLRQRHVTIQICVQYARASSITRQIEQERCLCCREAGE